MFKLGFIFMVNDSLELSVTFVPHVLPQHQPMVEVEFKAAVVVDFGLTQTVNILSLSSFRRRSLSCGLVSV